MNNFAIIFDMDGVIVDTNPYHKIALKQFCLKYGIRFSESELRSRVFGRTNLEWLRHVFGEHTPTNILKEYEHEKEALFRKIYKPYIKPVKGLTSFLKTLEESNIKMAIASSAPKDNVDFVIEFLKISDLFEAILHGDSVNNGKPHPEIYLKAANMLDCPSNQCVVIEDSLSGIESAKRAGCKVIGITTTHEMSELTNTIFNIKDFDDMSLEKIVQYID